MRSSIVLLLSTLALLIPLSYSQVKDFEYDDQDEWTGNCNTGSLQSPIDIDDDDKTCDETMIFDLTLTTGNSSLTVVDDGESYVVAYTGSTLYASDVSGILTAYQSVNFHFHIPSEHQIDGETYDLEMHMLHSITTSFLNKNLTTRTSAAVSILFEVDDSSAANPFITALNFTKIATARTLNMNTLLISQLPSPIPFYTYQGSTTTPPCNETVNWYVVTTPLKITTAQLAPFKTRFLSNLTFASGAGNNRDVQPLNDRTIKKGGVTCEEQFVYFFSFIILFIFINYFVFKLL